MSHTQGAITAKAALQLLGVLEHRDRACRPSLAPPTTRSRSSATALVAAGLLES